MDQHPKFALGDDVFVRDPQRFDPDCKSRTGVIKEFELRSDGYWYGFANKGFPTTGKWLWHHEADLGARLGTPISQLSGRPGTAGYSDFVRIAASWGYN